MLSVGINVFSFISCNLSFTDSGSLVAAENATYVPPSKVPYEFSMTTTVKGYHKVTSVTSNKVNLNVQFENENKIAKVGNCWISFIGLI